MPVSATALQGTEVGVGGRREREMGRSCFKDDPVFCSVSTVEISYLIPVTNGDLSGLVL